MLWTCRTLGFSMTASATTEYKLEYASDGKVIRDEVVALPYTAKWGDAPDTDARVRLAVAGAIRENNTQLIRLLASGENGRRVKPQGGSQ